MRGLAVQTVLYSSQYRPEARAVFAAMTTPPSAARRKLIDTLVRSLVSLGVWGQLDGFAESAADDAQASLLNWRDPTHSFTAVNSPTFVANKGWSFAATQCLSTGYNFSTGVPNAKFSTASAHIFVYCNTNVANTLSSDFGSDSASVAINANYGSNIYGRLNYGTGADAFGSVSTSIGMTLMNRTDSANAQYCKDGAVLYNRTVGASGLPTNLIIGNFTNGDATRYSRRQISAFGFGGGLPIAVLPGYFNAVKTYNQAVGAV